MFATQDVRTIENRRAVEELMAERAADSAVSVYAVTTAPTAKEHALPDEVGGGVRYQTCGGGRRRMPHRSRAD